MGAGTGILSADAFLVIVSNKYSIGRDTNTGPLGELIANWQARWIVDGSNDLALTPKLHLTQPSISRAGPPISERWPSHWAPTSGPGSSPKPRDSPVNTTMGTCSCNAPRRAMAACSAPTVV